MNIQKFPLVYVSAASFNMAASKRSCDCYGVPMKLSMAWRETDNQSQSSFLPALDSKNNRALDCAPIHTFELDS